MGVRFVVDISARASRKAAQLAKSLSRAVCHVSRRRVIGRDLGRVYSRQSTGECKVFVLVKRVQHNLQRISIVDRNDSPDTFRTCQREGRRMEGWRRWLCRHLSSICRRIVVRPLPFSNISCDCRSQSDRVETLFSTTDLERRNETKCFSFVRICRFTNSVFGCLSYYR